MITWRIWKPRRITADGPTLHYGVGDCLSTDTKPTTGIFNGSKLDEMDTKKAYKFDAQSATWREAPSGSGSGSADEALTEDEVEEILDDA